MPLVKCRNFTTEGVPINGGCRQSGCKFVHPHEDAWKRAADRSRGPSTSTTNDRSWDKDSWLGPKVVSGSNQQSIGTRNLNPDPPRWGAAPANAPKQPRAASAGRGTSSVGWGELNKDGNGWGETSKDGNRWGETSKDGNRWGETNKDGNGWGDIPSSWPGSSNAQEKSTVAGTDEKTKPPAQAPVKPVVSKPLSDYDKMDVDPRPVPPNDSKSTPFPASPIIPMSPSVPLSGAGVSYPGPSSVSALPRVPLPKATRRVTIPSSSNLTEIHAETLATRSEALPPAPSSLGPADRSALFTNVIRNMQHVTRLQIHSQKIRREEEDFKRAQNSDLYSRATPATREKFAKARLEYSRQLTDTQKRLKRALTTLVQLPDFSTPAKQPRDPALDGERVLRYTEELRAWIEDLELEKRIPQEESEALESSNEQQEDIKMADPVPTGAELKARGTWTWNEIKDALKDLEIRVERTTEDLAMNAYTHYDKIEAEFEKEAEGFILEKKAEHVALNVEEAQRLSLQADVVGDALSAQAMLAADVITRIRVQEAELAEITAETKMIQNMCKEATDTVDKFEKWRQEDAQRITNLTLQIQSLYKTRQVTAGPRPIQLDNLQTLTRNLIITQLDREIKPILEGFRQSCVQNNERLGKEVNEMLDPIIRQTDEICRAQVQI